jgi:hypothetical protein
MVELTTEQNNKEIETNEKIENKSQYINEYDNTSTSTVEVHHNHNITIDFGYLGWGVGVFLIVATVVSILNLAND